MGHFVSALQRLLAIVVFLLATFFPPYGFMWLVMDHFMKAPLGFSLGIAIWLIVFLLILPLPLKLFRLLSTLAVASVLGFTMWTLGNEGWLSQSSAVILAAIGCAAIVLFWLMIANPIWRWARFTVVVQSGHHD